jgi:hypothetical protein
MIKSKSGRLPLKGTQHAILSTVVDFNQRRKSKKRLRLREGATGGRGGGYDRMFLPQSVYVVLSRERIWILWHFLVNLCMYSFALYSLSLSKQRGKKCEQSANLLSQLCEVISIEVAWNWFNGSVYEAINNSSFLRQSLQLCSTACS